MVTGKMEVCPQCNGEGHHVRRDLDDTAMVESMQQDCDYEGIKNYMNGGFDEICTMCKGQNVVLTPDPNSIPKWAQEVIKEWEADEAEAKAEEAMERFWGA